MDTPSTPPPLTPPKPPPRPLGWWFVTLLLLPLLPLIISLLISLTGGREAQNSGAPLVFLFLALPLMLGCSIACAYQVGTRKGVGLGILTFIGAQVVYISLGFGGCVASLQHMDFR